MVGECWEAFCVIGVAQSDGWGSAGSRLRGVGKGGGKAFVFEGWLKAAARLGWGGAGRPFV
jgi:hypothetical protein